MKLRGIPGQKEKSVASAFVSIILFLIFVSISGFVLGGCLRNGLMGLGKGVVPQSLLLIAAEGSLWVSALLSAAFVFCFIDHRPFSDLGFGWRGRGKDMLGGGIAAVAIFAVGFGLSVWAGAVEVTGFHVMPADVISGLLFFLLVALAEETIVRGYILGRLLRTRLNRYFSLILTAVLFAALHLRNPNVACLPMLNLILAGILLGSSYIYTRNLWFPVFLHWFWNWVQGPVLGYDVSGNHLFTSMLTLRLSGNTIMSGGAFGFEGSIVCTVLLVISTGVIIGYYERKPGVS